MSEADSYPDPGELKRRVSAIMTDYKDGERAPSTRRTYRHAWEDFCAFCETMETGSLPADPETAAQYVLYCAEDRDLAPATLQKRLAAIRYYHRKNEHRSPTRAAIVDEAMEQVRRRKSTKQRQADPLLTTGIARMLDELNPGRDQPKAAAGVARKAAWLRDRRNAALIALGYAGAFRRDELRRIDIGNVRISAERVRVRVPQSKTDQHGRGEIVTIRAGTTRHDPVGLLQGWVGTAGIEDGPVFRGVTRAANLQNAPLTGRTVLYAIRQAAEAADVDGYITAHSLRAGYATQALLSGLPREEVMQHMRLSSVQTFMRYVRIAEQETADRTGALGL